MNERNVAALKAAMRSLPLTPLAEHELGSWIPQLAAELAKMGVLVPSALSEPEATALVRPPTHLQFYSGWMVAELERIAKGEPT